MNGQYNKNSKLDFGMYEGYELGIVYVFDPSYIDWCINNIDKFYIVDFDELKEFGVINEKLDWRYKLIGYPNLIPNIDAFKTFQELLENVDLGDKKYKFSFETIEKNSKKFEIGYENRSITNNNDEVEENEYEENERYGGYDDYNDYDSPRYEKYGKYNGWSDQDIDDVFGGEPMNTWNID